MITLPNKSDPGGRVSFLEHGKKILPFDFKRVFWITNVYNSSIRGRHAHKQCEQFLVAVNGRCKIHSIDQSGKKTFHNLVSPTCGLYVPPMQWIALTDFSRDTVIMVLASHEYKEDDYIRDPEEFGLPNEDPS